MTIYRIYNADSGADLGTYEGSTEADAIRAMLSDAGHEGEPDEALRAVPVTDCIYCDREVTDTTSKPVPALHDAAAWRLLAGEHAPDCEWIATRAHRLDGREVQP